MQRGYIKLFRCIKDNELWSSEPFTRGQAWVDLLIIANHKEGIIRRRGIRVVVRRGEVGMSLRELSDRWKWSVGKIQRFFDELKIDTQIHHRIDTENVSVTTLICITNYETYQSCDTETGTETGTEVDTETDTETIRKRVQNKNGKNGKKEKKKEEPLKPLVVSLPEWLPKEAWELYLKKRKEIKKPLLEDAWHLAFAKLEKLREAGHDPEAVLNQSSFAGWQGLFEIKQGTATGDRPRSFREQVNRAAGDAFERGEY